MTGEAIPVKVPAVQLIANVSPALCRALKLKKLHRCIGLISADSDDATYIALDEATKAANVEVVYGRSLYAGAANASTPLAGEVIGILGGQNPSEVSGGLQAALSALHQISFRKLENGTIYLAHCISRTGSYLSKTAKIPAGQAIAYLIAPPVEAIVGVDAALKASDVELAEFFSPPTETNFGGALLTGTQSACRAACDAFAAAVSAVAQAPKGGAYGI